MRTGRRPGEGEEGEELVRKQRGMAGVDGAA